MKRIVGYSLVYLVSVSVISCNNASSPESDAGQSATDTNFSDSRRNSTGTSNTITGDSTATLDSAMHKGRQN